MVLAASVADQGYGLAVIAMVTAAIAAFFYLRVAVPMFSPVGADGDEPDGVGAADTPAVPAPRRREGAAPAGRPTGDHGGRSPGADRRAAGEPDVAARRRWCPSRPRTAVAIGLCVAFSVVFGIIPGPILDFTHDATLLLLR